LSYEQEVEMEKKAFEKGIVRVNLDKFVTFTSAKEVAEEKAGGLATREELKQSDIYFPKLDRWMYFKREDGLSDVLNLGDHPSGKGKYISHRDEFQAAGWMEEPEIADWRPLGFIYAKRDPVKNPEFVQAPNDPPKEKKEEK